MNFPSKIFMAGITVSLLLNSSMARANKVTVQEVSVNPCQSVYVSVAGFYTGYALAGVNKLLVAKTAMDGFCIDPYHFSSTAELTYTVVPLNQAPKAPGTMTTAQAVQIGKLWSMCYSTTMSASTAAGMQIAIWDIVGGSNFSITGSDYGARNMLSSLTTYTGAGADLVGLTGAGQDYVVKRTAALVVPDQGSTLCLLGLTVGAMLLVTPKYNHARFSVLVR